MNAAPEVEPGLSVLIVTWNVRELTLACITSVVRETAGTPTEIIVVDNASTDGTPDAVSAQFPQVVVRRNMDNPGFPAACNQALALARGEYVLFLNPDTEVGPGAIAACMEELQHDVAAAMCGCKLVLEDGSVQLECARTPYLLRHLLMETFYLHVLLPRSRMFGDHRMSYWDHDDTRDVEAISGAFMLVRSTAARAVGGLPEDVFMYHEDLAFCLRLRRAGWRIRYRSDVTTLHRWRASSAQAGELPALLEGVSKLALIREAQGPAAAMAGRVLFGVRSVLRLAAAGVSLPLPLGAARRRYPRAFDIRAHALQLAWATMPSLVEHRLPPLARSRHTQSA
ncbi:MAG: glycosyltransferase family 2 protein [Gemmatimonadota bacterium]